MNLMCALRRLTGLLICSFLLCACQVAKEPPNAATELAQEKGLHRLQAISAQEEPVYDALRTYKAQAIATALRPFTNTPEQTPSDDRSDETSIPLTFTHNVSNQSNPVAAALAALSLCEQERERRITPTHPCEIRRRNAQIIHNTTELTEDLDAKRPAFIWELEHNGNQLYLAGSIHVLKPTLKAPPSYTQAFERSSVLVLEVDQSSEAPQHVQALVQRYSQAPAGQHLSDLLEPAELQRVHDYLATWGIDANAAEPVKPAMLLLQAGVFEYVAMGYLADHGIDRVLENAKGNRVLFGLETMEQQLAAATALPIELQAELLLETINEADLASLQISSLVHAWLSGDEEYLSSQFENATDSPAARQWLDDLLAKRNVGMANGIADILNGLDPRVPKDSTHNSQEPVFVVVGAAHLVGEGSVIELLKQQGFTADRLRNDSLTKIN